MTTGRQAGPFDDYLIRTGGVIAAKNPPLTAEVNARIASPHGHHVGIAVAMNVADRPIRLESVESGDAVGTGSQVERFGSASFDLQQSPQGLQTGIPMPPGHD